MLRIQTILFTDPDPAFQFDTAPVFYLRIRIRRFGTDPDPYCFKEGMYLKRYKVYLHLNTYILT
jgi:hypothetical protein